MRNAAGGHAATPYIGLAPYRENDADFFFGRDADVRIVAANLHASRLTILYGPSGVGKTSLLQAGVVHGLRDQVLANVPRGTEKASFAICAFGRWRDDPLPLLAEAIRASALEALGHRRELTPWTPGEPLVEALLGWTQHVRTLLVVLDQFEEYFLYHGGEEGPGTFAEEFPMLVNEPNLRANFLISIREDAWAKLDRFQGRVVRLFANYVRVAHLDRAAAGQAIAEPIAEWNERLPRGQEPYRVEGALVEAVIDAAGGPMRAGDAGGPRLDETPVDNVEAPFLQLVMERLWRATVAAGSRTLSLATLAQLGGAQQIVENHLFDAVAALTPEEQSLAADLFRYLVTGSKAKIAHSASNLAEWVGRPEPDVTAVLEKLALPETGRILRRVPPPPTESAEMRYELFHDVLAEPVLDWRRAHERERERRAAVRRLVRVGGSLLAIAAVFAALGIWALVQRAEARRATASATSLALASSAERQLDDGRIETALLLGLDAYEASPSAEAKSSMIRALEAARSSGADAILRGFRNGVRAVAFDPRGRTLATASFDGPIQLWDVATRRPRGPPLRGHTGEVWSVAFSADGRALASASKDGTVRLWNVKTHMPLGQPVEAGVGEVLAVALSSDGRTLALAGDDGTIRLLDLRTRQPLAPPLEGHTARVVSLAFAPDGRTLASGGDDASVRLWDVRTRRPRGEALRGHTAEVVSVAFSPDGRTLASSSLDGSIRLWGVADGAALGKPLLPQAGQIWSVAFSRDGRTLAGSGSDGTVRLWDARTGRPMGEPLRGHADRVVVVAFAPTGVLASSGYDGTVRLWRIAGHRSLGEPLGTHESAVNGVAFSPDGRVLASAGDDKAVDLWDVRNRKRIGRLAGDTDAFEAVAFSPDGRVLAAASDDHTVWLWDVAARRRLARLRGHEDAVRSLAFGPDGRLLASTGSDHTLRVWDVGHRKQVGLPLRGHDELVWDVAFSADGRTLASAGFDGTVRLWDIRDRKNGGVILDRSEEQPYSVAFDPAGTTLAVGTVSGLVRLWDVRSRRPLGEPIKAGDTRIETIAFSNDGKTLVSGRDDGVIQLWDVDARKELGRPLGARGKEAVRGLAFSPDRRTIASGDADGAVRLWDGILWSDLADLRAKVCGLVAGNLTRSEWDELAAGLDYRATCAS